MHDGTWVDGGGRIIYDWAGRYAGSPYHQYMGSPVTTVAGLHWDVPRDDLLYGVTALDKQHVPGNGALDDNTLQREQACYWMAHQIGLTAGPEPPLLRLISSTATATAAHGRCRSPRWQT